jgi:hypothetical protein
MKIKMNSKPSIDSVFIQIPISQVKLQSTLLGEYVSDVSLSSGQIEDGVRFKTQHFHKENGINTELSIGTLYRGFKSGDNSEQVLQIKLTSKQLKERYFEGITSDNVIHLHTYLTGLGVAEFSLDAMLSARWVDFDVKTDFQEHGKGLDYVRDTINKLVKYVNPKYKSNSATYREGYSHFNKPNNNGLQFLDRKKAIGRSLAPYKNQFCKFYNKSLMLSSDKESSKFADAYLKGQNLDNILRYESGVKGNALRDYYGLPSTFGKLLKVDESTLLQILRKPLETHLDFDKVQKVKTEAKSNGFKQLSEMLVADKLNELMKPSNGKNGLGYDEAVESMVNEVYPLADDRPFTQVEKNGRSRMRTQISEAWKKHHPNKREVYKNAQLVAFPELNKRLNLRLSYK